MSDAYFEDQDFQAKDYTSDPLPIGTYEYCRFTNCNFASADLSRIKFVDCTFGSCDLSMADLELTTFRDAQFNQCKMIGLHFEYGNNTLFSASFSECNLQVVSFYRMKLKGITFKQCNLQEVEFSEADLTGVIFDRCNMLNATFENSILEQADFRTAVNYSFDPDLNRIRGAKFSSTGLAGLLKKYDIEVE